MRAQLAGIAAVVMVLLWLILAGCGGGPGPKSQASVRQGQDVWRIVFPIFEAVVLAGLDWLRPEPMPADPEPGP